MGGARPKVMTRLRGLEEEESRAGTMEVVGVEKKKTRSERVLEKEKEKMEKLMKKFGDVDMNVELWEREVSREEEWVRVEHVRERLRSLDEMKEKLGVARAARDEIWEDVRYQNEVVMALEAKVMGSMVVDPGQERMSPKEKRTVSFREPEKEEPGSINIAPEGMEEVPEGPEVGTWAEEVERVVEEMVETLVEEVVQEEATGDESVNEGDVMGLVDDEPGDWWEVWSSTDGRLPWVPNKWAQCVKGNGWMREIWGAWCKFVVDLEDAQEPQEKRLVVAFAREWFHHQLGSVRDQLWQTGAEHSKYKRGMVAYGVGKMLMSVEAWKMVWDHTGKYGVWVREEWEGNAFKRWALEAAANMPGTDEYEAGRAKVEELMQDQGWPAEAEDRRIVGMFGL